MSVLETIKKAFVKSDSGEYLNSVKKMNYEIEKLKVELDNFIELNNNIIKDPNLIFEIEFHKIDNYIETMDSIKHKDVSLIKEYQLLVMKYNIQVELYKKLRKNISKFEGNTLIQFKHNQFNQPIFILSPLQNNLHKILLISSSPQNDILEYDIDLDSEELVVGTIQIMDENEHNFNLLMNMLFDIVEKYNNEKKIIGKIVFKNNLINEIPMTYLEHLLKTHRFEGFKDKFIKII